MQKLWLMGNVRQGQLLHATHHDSRDCRAGAEGALEHKAVLEGGLHHALPGVPWRELLYAMPVLPLVLALAVLRDGWLLPGCPMPELYSLATASIICL
jgi:hypothetical protein